MEGESRHQGLRMCMSQVWGPTPAAGSSGPVTVPRGSPRRQKRSVKQVRPRTNGAGPDPLNKYCPAVTYSPTSSRMQYHRRCGS